MRGNAPSVATVSLNSVVATEFATIMYPLRSTIVVCTSVASLGFERGADRATIYQHAMKSGFGMVPGDIAIRWINMLETSDGTLHLWMADESRQDGSYFYGYAIDWPDGKFMCRHDIALSSEVLPPEAQLVLRRRFIPA